MVLTKLNHQPTYELPPPNHVHHCHKNPIWQISHIGSEGNLVFLLSPEPNCSPTDSGDNLYKEEHSLSYGR